MKWNVNLGIHGERQATKFLLKNGLKLICKNYRCKVGEIDLIMQDKEFLVFIEVRVRTSKDYGGALASVTYGKQQKLLRAASYYLMINNLKEIYPLRFDLVCFDGKDLDIFWIKNAFGVDF